KCNHKPVGGQCGTGENDSYVLGPHNPIVSIFTDVKTSDTGSDDTGGGGGDTDTGGDDDTTPWKYSGEATFVSTATASWGIGGSAALTETSVLDITLNADGSVNATRQGAYGWSVRCDEDHPDNGEVRVVETPHTVTYSGTHGNGSFSMEIANARNSELSGTYDADSLNIQDGFVTSSTNYNCGVVTFTHSRSFGEFTRTNPPAAQ
ncbi:MAG: hypothetical protein ACNS63_00375, partial [Candidatus Nitrospinota bacterium M3_3B_026]